MSKYTENQAKQKAQMVVSQVGAKILAAVAGTSIAPAFLAGKIGVEAGVRAGKIVETATRYEAGVFQDLRDLRDKGYCIVSGKTKTNYSGVGRQQILGASDAALTALATSYGLSQIMGWHMVNNLKGTIADLRDTDKHLIYTIKLMQLVAGSFLTNKDYEACLRIWNTGRANGKTYDPNYVHNALLVMKFAAPLLAELQKTVKGSSMKTAQTQLQVELGTDDPQEVIKQAETTIFMNEMEPHEFGAAEELPEQAEEIKTAPAATSSQPDTTQQAENIINLGDQSQSKAPAQEPETKNMQAPASEGIGSKLNGWLTALGLGVPTVSGVVAAVKGLGADGSVNWTELLQVFLQMLLFILPYLVYLLIAYVIYRTIKMILVQISFMVRMWINGDTAKNDIKLIHPVPAEPVAKSWLNIF